MADEARYLYSTVRVVSDPANGEFATIAAVAGSDETGDWFVRRLQNDARAARFCGADAIAAANDFLARLELSIADWTDPSMELDLTEQSQGGERPSEKWLAETAGWRRHVVQLSPPSPIIAASAADALDLVFDSMFHEPESRKRPMTKWALSSALNKSYSRVGLKSGQDFSQNVQLAASGPHMYSYPVDYAVIAHRAAVQLVQMWSFRIASGQAGSLSRDVKAWGWTLRELQKHGGTIAVGQQQISVPNNVDVEVVLAPPVESRLEKPYEEAQAVFEVVNARVLSHGHEERVAERAAQLLAQGIGTNG
jgi:hypothetical protein